MALSQIGLPGQANKANPDRLFQMPPQFSIQKPDFGKGLGSGNSLKAMPPVLLAPPKVHMNQAEIDPGIIVAPPKQFDAQDKGTPVAQNLYPNLRLMPLGAGKLEPIPTEWPRLKVEQIPTVWPNLRMTAVGKPDGIVTGIGSGK